MAVPNLSGCGTRTPNCEVVCHFCHSKYQYDLNALLAEYDAQAAQAAEAEHTVQ